MKNKRGFLQISFPWLFAIIVGGVILFLAIYASTKIIQTEQTALDAETAREFGVLLNPLETGFESGRTSSVTFPTDARIHNICNTENIFGRQAIRVSQMSFGEWTETDVSVGFTNKYIMSENTTQGKKFLLFSKPIEFPFKVTDIIYLTSTEKNYCFIDAPEEIEDEISDLNQENLLVNDCKSNSVRVCFNSGEGCEIIVNYPGKYVQKQNNRMYFYSDSLMYGAIFSDTEIYECQLKRVMQRAKELSLLYKDKAEFIQKQDCSSNLNQELLELSNLENSLESSANLNSHMINLVESLETKNSISECKLW